MPKQSDNKPLNTSDIRGPEAHFAAYCETESERLHNSGEVFDAPLFQEAVKLAKRKLRARMTRGIK